MIVETIKINPVPGLSFLTEQEGKQCHKHMLDGHEIPGCTSISGLFQDDGWKFAWPVKLMYETSMARFRKVAGTGSAGWVEMKIEQIDALLKDTKNAWRKKRDKSADTGTMAHKYIEDYIQIGIKIPPTVNDEIKNIFNEFIRWEKEHVPVWCASELQVGSIVHGFAGILDALACNVTGGSLTLMDFKTSGAIKDEYAIQLAGLCICLEEMGVRIKQRAILHLPKEGKFEYRIIDSDLSRDKAAFLAALEFYRHKNLFMGRCKSDKRIAA